MEHKNRHLFHKWSKGRAAGTGLPLNKVRIAGQTNLVLSSTTCCMQYSDFFGVCCALGRSSGLCSGEQKWEFSLFSPSPETISFLKKLISLINTTLISFNFPIALSSSPSGFCPRMSPAATYGSRDRDKLWLSPLEC